MPSDFYGWGAPAYVKPKRPRSRPVSAQSDSFDGSIGAYPMRPLPTDSYYGLKVMIVRKTNGYFSHGSHSVPAALVGTILGKGDSAQALAQATFLKEEVLKTLCAVDFGGSRGILLIRRADLVLG